MQIGVSELYLIFSHNETLPMRSSFWYGMKENYLVKTVFCEFLKKSISFLLVEEVY